jgi:hypothetical protein
VRIIHGGRGSDGRLASILALTLGLLVWPIVGHARAVPASADSIVRDDALLFPKAPCTQDTVTVFVRGWIATPCDSFLGAEKTGPRSIVVRSQVYAYRQCLAAPFQFFSVPVVMGTFPAGSSSIEIVHEVIGIGGENARDTTRTSSSLSFDVSPVCQPPVPVPAEELPYVLHVGTVPNPPCPNQAVTIHVDGAFRDGCGRVVAVDPEHLALTIAPFPPQPTACAMAIQPWSAEFPLGVHAAGHFHATIRMTVLGTDATWPPIPTQTYLGAFDFDVPSSCPAPIALPDVDFIYIDSGRSCSVLRPDAGGVACAGDSIRVLMGGRFPSSCYRVADVQLVDLGYGSPIPMPPMVRLVVTDEGCTKIPCSADSVPWFRSITLGPLIARDYGLIVQEVRILGCPTLPRDTTTAVVPFKVLPEDQCALACNCLRPAWPSPSTGSRCTATISPGGAAAVTLAIQTNVALAGLQGALHAGGAGLRITKLEAVGAAEGMNLNWTRTTDGVRFVMYATAGAPIAASGQGVPVLRVSVELAAGSTEPQYQVTTGSDLLGSDAQGSAVPLCPMIALALAPAAILCVGQEQCDFNADQQVDVRDLVLMVRCLSGAGPCPPDAAEHFDCDADSVFDLGDVLCCALQVLRDPGCPQCPVDSVRDEPAIALDFAAPVPKPDGIDLPIHVRGMPLIGAARLRLRFPADRFYVSGVDVRGSLSLHDVESDEVVLGMIGPFPVVDPLPGQPLPPDAVLHLALRPGRSTGGQVSVIGGDFSGPDGVALRTSLGQPSVTLGSSGSGLTLSRAAPNPFSGLTRFSVTLDRSAALQVGVYDLAGRKIATLWKGTMIAGTHAFTWNGGTDQGTSAKGGVYFYRATTDDATATGRMILLESR